MEQYKARLLRLVQSGRFEDTDIDQLRVLIIKSCKTKEQLTDIVDFFDDLRKKGLAYGPYSSSTLLHQLAQFKMVKTAQRTFVNMIASGFKPNLWTYMPIINMLCRHALVPEAESYLDRMLKFGVCPNVYVFTSLILGYCRDKDIKSGFRVWKEMTDQGITPNTLTYNHLINALCHVGRVDDALDMLNTMIGNGIEPTARTFTLPISSMREADMAMKTLDLVVIMRKRGCPPNAEHYSPLIGGLFKISQPKLAIGVHHHTVKSRMIPLNTSTYNDLLHGLRTTRMFDAALMNFDWMEGHNNLSNSITYGEIIRVWCLIGNLNKGMMLLSKMTNVDPLPTVVSYNILMYGCIEQMDLQNAVRLLSLMKENGLKPDQRTYVVLINGFCKAGDLDRGLALFGEMVEQKVIPNEYHYTPLIDAHIKQDQVEIVLFLLREEGCRPEAEVYNSIIDCFL
ncbi:pentatricopeptide repeat-containing protein At5g65560-like [Cynara cardunculus var. scolymus]|uniref:Pentatricopeptide repeat-containing protein n=1 Tax=Cynara cardunculus var. scolymus TaxID=59895 RepID=A0A103XVE9_CYNCS|nr:pentatricopeptide repeat-containing protein At5g65560-like [Cynara cardunculus var. scolymus]KVH97608.1 Pentatricopeptide repeat-containing protein [Cynara cardunculus var. scolymus]